jgi:hypothetical protein
MALEGRSVVGRFSVLVGNGLSIAYEPELAIANLTTTLLDEFEGLGGAVPPGRASEVLVNLAHAVRGFDPDRSNFEALLGPVQAAAAVGPVLHELGALIEHAAPDDLLQATQVLEAYLGSVHRIGLATALGVIAARSRAELDSSAFQDTIGMFTRQLLGLGHPADLTVATLNYDGLLHAALRDAGADFADLADGRVGGQWQLSNQHLSGRLLRSHADLPDDRLRLLQMHGSLAWLQNPDDGAVWKFDLASLRALDGYWSAWRDERVEWRPVVVLTDIKDHIVTEWPFRMAYEAYRRSLVAADRWLIVGYGFQDAPVNRALAEAYSAHPQAKDLGVLVVGYGIEDEIRGTVQDATGIPEGQIAVDGNGVPAALAGAEWQAWAAP